MLVNSINCSPVKLRFRLYIVYLHAISPVMAVDSAVRRARCRAGLALKVESRAGAFAQATAAVDAMLTQDNWSFGTRRATQKRLIRKVYASWR